MIVNLKKIQAMLVSKKKKDDARGFDHLHQ